MQSQECGRRILSPKWREMLRVINPRGLAWSATKDFSLLQNVALARPTDFDSWEALLVETAAVQGALLVEAAAVQEALVLLKQTAMK